MDPTDSDASSEDEERLYPAVDGPTHPQRSAGVFSSMYSRIYEDVRLQIPTIDLQGLEVSPC